MLHVDHVVPLKEAFLSGANQWSSEKKVRYTNDLENKDPARWLPPNEAYHQEYVTIWLEIKKA